MKAGSGPDLDARKALGLAGEGPVLGLHVEVTESEGQAHSIESQQLRPVHYSCKIAAQRGVVSPQILQEGGAVLKSRPGERLHVTSMQRGTQSCVGIRRRCNLSDQAKYSIKPNQLTLDVLPSPYSCFAH